MLRSRRFIFGFSLVEMMIVFIISSILSMLAAPQLSYWVDSARAKSVRMNLRSFLVEARSIALTQSDTITVCQLQGDHCKSEFGFPLSMYVDNNRNAVLDSDEYIVRVLDMDLTNNISIKWNRHKYLRFWPSGGTGALTGSLSYCNQLFPDFDFRLVIARTGRVRVDENASRCD